MWVVSTAKSVAFILDPSRSGRIPQTFFGDKAEGILMVDRYAAYKNMDNKVLLAFCWAHVRRDFIRAKDGYEALEKWGSKWLKRINTLYQLNAKRLDAEKGSKAYQEADQALRKHVRSMKKWSEEEVKLKQLHAQREKVIKSLIRHWDGLCVFVDHPLVPMDNNEAERCLRNAVVGRKTYYGSGAEWGGDLSSWLFSLFETLKKNRVNPMTYLTAYLTACAQAGGKAPGDLTPFLPWNWQKHPKLAA